MTDNNVNELRVDPDRIRRRLDQTYEGDRTGIYVRARGADGLWCNVDIAALDRVSLLAWLRSRGGHNKWAELVVLLLLEHELEEEQS